MTPERFRQISQLYHAALEREPEQREAFLQQSCGRDPALRQEVELLLEGGESAEAFLLSKAMNEAVNRLSDEASLVGRALGRYQVLSLLGSGGMGEVYRARDSELGREVAIKVLPASFNSGADRLRFEREARSASALNHPNILTIYEIAQKDEHRFIASEFVDGETLRERLTKGRMKLDEALDVAIQIASALSAAHTAGIVHRDIKPENIMLRRDDLVKVLDFGLAKQTEPQATKTSPEEPTMEWLYTGPGVVLGTSAYMSPEQTRGLPVDPRTDIWSLGIVLYEMIAGQVPFAGATRSDIIASILRKELPSLGDDAPDGTRALSPILRKALSKDKEERYQTAAELLNDLRGLRENLSAQSKLLNSTEVKPSNWVNQRKRVMVPIALVLIAVVGIVLALYRVAGRSHSNSVLPAPRIVPFTTFPGRELQPAFSPDGNQIAFVWNGEKGDNFDIYIRLVNTATRPLRLTSSEADDLYPAWSPDGQQIAFVRQSGTQTTILMVPALGGPERKLYTGTSGFFSLYEYGNALSWSPDGKYLAFSGQRTPRDANNIFLLSLETLERRQVTTPPAGFLGDSNPAYSPDGKLLAFVRGASSRDIEIYVIPASGGEPKRLTFDNRSGRSLAWTADSREIVFSQWYYGSLRLWRMPANGGTPVELSIGIEGASTLAISRQGNRLAYSEEVRDTNVWRIGINVPPAKRSPEKFISSTRLDYAPQYSPNGKKIAFTSGRSGSNEIWVCDVDGMNPVQLTTFGGPDVGSPRWSPDSRQIAFDSIAKGNRDVFVVSAEGGKPRQLTEDPSDEVRPSWSPDGNWIYFGCNRTEDWQVWKTPAAGGQAVQVTRQGGREAFESFDSKFIYYTKGFGIPGIWRVAPTGGEETRILEEPIQGFWALAKNGIYFVNLKAAPRSTIDFFNFDTSHSRQVAAIEKELQLVYPSLSVSPDGSSLLYVQVDSFESDILLTENFR